jgi:hypothetical protein
MTRDAIPPGTLHLLILRTLARDGEMHGFEIAESIQRLSSDVLTVEEGSLYPALQRLLVNGSRGGLLLVLDPIWPGWVAAVDGKITEIFRANYLFRAVAMPPGDHRVDMVYRPPSVRFGLVITLLAAILAIVTLSARSTRW